MTPEQQVIALAGFIGTCGLAALRWLAAKYEKCEADRATERATATTAMDKLADAMNRQLERAGQEKTP
jgi:hypothetical protein